MFVTFHALQQASGQEQCSIDYVMSTKFNPELIGKSNPDGRSTT